MLQLLSILLMIFPFSFLSVIGATAAEAENSSIYDFSMTDIDGKEVSLSEYRGKVLLIVNVASKCGFTTQYEGLQELYSQYQDKGLVVLGFPANNFKNQEPGSNQEIQEFCTVNYGVTFPMFSKISVKGEDIHPLYRFLTSEETNPEFAGEITWNFNKFLVDPAGKVVARFDSPDKPTSKKVVEAIQKQLH
ncbi:MAG: glutathione peroxidase [Calditrichaeota bacterium]|nr:glutathione peroxidase [Calditrichota bacterium]RQW03966.1 MAG: glutathione peroxidase [Calditrichota bacterium]